MTKADFIQIVQVELGDDTPKSTIDEVLKAASRAGLGLLMEKSPFKMPIIGLGALKAFDKKARRVRNPRTGEIVDIPARRVIKFVPAKPLKDFLKGEWRNEKSSTALR